MIVTIGIIALNEEDYLPSLFEELERQTYPLEKIELILVDSLSKDNTKKLMLDLKKKKNFYKVSIFNNEKKVQSSGWNQVIDHFNGDILIRLDAHSSIPTDFVEKRVNLIKKGEVVCGGLRTTLIKNETPYRQMLLSAENSLFGSSIAPYRKSEGTKYVKSIFHGAYTREVINAVGHFNEKLLRTEDNEFHYRIREKGYLIAYSDQLVSYQYARATLQTMMKQKFGNGKWTALTLFVCPGAVSIYHFVPFCFLIALIISLFFCVITPWVFILVMGSYLIFNLTVTLIEWYRHHFAPVYLLLPLVFFLLHISYGIGSLDGFIHLKRFLKDYRS